MQLRVLFLAFVAISTTPGIRSQTTVYSTDFDNGAPAQISGIASTESVQGYAAIGCFSGNFLRNKSGCGPGSTALAPTTLTLTQLPAHSTVSINFLLAIIDTWDGLTPCCGADYFEVRVDGTPVFTASFKNAFGGGHPYSPSPGVLLVENVQLGFRSTNTNDQDSAFDMGNEPALQSIPHTSSTLTVQWSAFGSGWHHTCLGADQDESWAIDNLSIVLDAALGQPAIVATTVGIGCSGPSAMLPSLGIHTLPSLGNPIMAVQISQGAANSYAYLAASLAPYPTISYSSYHIGHGCNIYLELLSMATLFTSGNFPILQPTGPSGATIYALPIPASICPGIQFGLQAVIVDPAAALGYSLTNALHIATH